MWLWLKFSGQARDETGDRKTNKRPPQEDEQAAPQ